MGKSDGEERGERRTTLAAVGQRTSN